MRVALLGFDTDGKVSYPYFVAQGHDVTICDQNPDVIVPEGASSQLGPSYLENLDRFDILVRTSGMPPHVITDPNPTVADKITTQVEVFLANAPTKNIIGVTGTKGKGTTCTLIAKMLEAAGKHVRIGGNIGIPPLSFINELREDSYVVLELSSFQLMNVQHSPHIAVCLMVVPEHLNWHSDMDEYIWAKSQLFANQTADDVAIYAGFNNVSTEIASAGSGKKLAFGVANTKGAKVQDGAIYIEGTEICKTDGIALLGEHNWQNACAAVSAVWQAGVRDNVAIQSVLTSFSGLPHRIEYVRTFEDVKFYNDSFATGLHATIAAIEAIPEKKVLVVGGFDRMLPLGHFANYVAGHPELFRTILLIGQSGPRVADELTKVGYTSFTLDTESDTIEKIIQHAVQKAEPGDAIVFSPGFASYDMFKNFEQRGELYKAAVEAL